MKTLVLPSADEAKSIWTKKFGFEKIDQEQVCTFLLALKVSRVHMLYNESIIFFLSAEYI